VTASGETGSPFLEFGAPPVVEVALGVQFRPLFGLRAVELAGLRERWRPRYPLVQELPPLPPTIEATGPAPVAFSFGPAFQSRLWFLDDEQAELVQLQHDRLTVNWRKSTEDAVYPRYAHLRQVFVDRFRELADFVDEAHLGSLRVTQVEINYINSIPLEGGHQGQLELVLRNWRQIKGHHLGKAEQARAAMVFNVPDLGLPPVRLYVTADPARRPDGQQVMFLTLTVRGAPSDEGVDEALVFLDRAHDHLVRSFAELTPTTMHERWEKHQ